MATVALPMVGSGPTLSMDWSRRAASRVRMLARAVADRFALWTRLEARADAWASWGALGFAAAATLALFAVGPF